jgi:AIPR protein
MPKSKARKNIIRSLFYDNVRDWQDFNPVNADIKQTIENKDERPRFALMNNGITVIAKKMRGTGNRFFIEDYQVVNGCQTSHVLYYSQQQLDESIMVPLRLLATNNENVITAIIKATNRQTEVKEEHLLALSDFSKKLEAFFPTFRPQHLYYERRSKQYNGDPNVEKTRVITPAYLIRAFASVFLEEPHRATRSYRTLLEGVGKSIFASDHRLEPYYLAAFILYRLEFIFRNQLLDPKYKPARVPHTAGSSDPCSTR